MVTSSYIELQGQKLLWVTGSYKVQELLRGTNSYICSLDQTKGKMSL